RPSGIVGPVPSTSATSRAGMSATFAYTRDSVVHEIARSQSAMTTHPNSKATQPVMTNSRRRRRNFMEAIIGMWDTRVSVTAVGESLLRPPLFEPAAFPTIDVWNQAIHVEEC